VGERRCQKIFLVPFAWRDAEKSRPEIVFPVTASVTKLFHNRHAKYRKYTESRLRSTTAQPPYVPSISGQRQSMPLKYRHPRKSKNRTGISIPVTASVTTLFRNRHAKYTKYTESRLRSTTAQPPFVPSISAQRQSMPMKNRHPHYDEKPDRKKYSPSPQASQHFSITATLNTGNTQKVAFVLRLLSHRMSHRFPVNGNRCL
jgi:hypothetical protein